MSVDTAGILLGIFLIITIIIGLGITKFLLSEHLENHPIPNPVKNWLTKRKEKRLNKDRVYVEETYSIQSIQIVIKMYDDTEYTFHLYSDLPRLDRHDMNFYKPKLNQLGKTYRDRIIGTSVGQKVANLITDINGTDNKSLFTIDELKLALLKDDIASISWGEPTTVKTKTFELARITIVEKDK